MLEKPTIRVLVTGATGFLGSNILRDLSDREGIECIAACRTPSRLDNTFVGEVRAGDLFDEGYRKHLMRDVDVVCHAGTWASMWGHKRLEYERFYQPSRDLIDQAIDHGVTRFILASTVAIGAVNRNGQAHADFSTRGKTGFWPHLDYLVDIDDYMREHSQQGTQMINMRLGHFIGRGNRLGLLPALVPRLKTWMVPWLAGGRKRVPLVADTDLARAFVLASISDGLNNYESFNICGSEFPSMREVITYISQQAGVPKPGYSVPYSVGYLFGWLMETLKPVMPGSSPFLTRSIVHLCEDWYCPSHYAANKLGYVPERNWKQVIDEHLADLKRDGYPWPVLCQP